MLSAISFNLNQSKVLSSCNGKNSWRIQALIVDLYCLSLHYIFCFKLDKINLIQKLKFDLGSVENIVRKGQNAGYKYFLLFPQYFETLAFSTSLKVGIVW